MASTGMIIDGVLGSQCVDSSGEILDVEGADISDLEEGRGVLNYEHLSAGERTDKDGIAVGQEIVGKIVTAKKVFSESDCDNARERAYWKKVKHPFIYGICRLYDGAGHEGAKALAAQIRDHAANGEPILVRFSVEGSTLEKDGNILKRSVIRRVALTLKPCNRTADSGLLEDPNAPTGFDKNPTQKVGDLLADLATDAKKMEHEHPGYQKLGGVTETEYVAFEEDDHRALVKALAKLKAIRKAMEGDRPVTVYRVENEHGQGPYEHYKGDLDALESEDAERHPSPYEDFDDPMARDANNRYGFESPEHAKQWFGNDLGRLAGQGFVVRAVPAAKIWRSKSGRQISFRPHSTYIPGRGEPVKKALTAGMGDVAPSQLSGGAALQREDLVRFKDKAMKTLKSFLDKNDDFERSQVVATFKQELPEASDDFIEHFANIAEDYKLKLRKDEHGNPYPQTNPNIGGGIGGADTRVDISAEPKGAVEPKRKKGLEMEPGGKVLLSPEKGARRRVSVQQHFPDDHLYHALLKPDEALENGHITPEEHELFMKTVHRPWHRAMAHWLPLNKALSEGKVPKGIIAKSVIFAAMSPNTSVPMQERYYGHYMDLLHEGKVDPFKPISQKAVDEFTQRSVSGQLPEWNRDYYEAHPLNINANGQNEDAEEDVDKGDLPQILGLRNAHKLFPYLEHLTAKHRDDTQQIAAELMDMKAQAKNYQQAKATAEREGKPFNRAPLDHDIGIGFGPKLTRYLMGMYGGGNMIVPDRHMVRSTFDLELEPDPERPGKFKGGPILSKLQTAVVTKAQNEHFLRAIDHNFFVKHPAVKHVLETFPKHFQGREQQAIFPAFWLHWLTINHYDRMRNRPHMGFNADTDHMVFWDSVRDEMIKHGLTPHPLHEGMAQDGDPDDSFDFGHLAKHQVGVDPWPRPDHVHNTPVWMKAAGCMEALRQKWGETPALLAFFSHIAPKMMKAETPAPPVQGMPHPAYHPHVLKAERLMIDLRKAMADTAAGDQALAELAPHIHHVYMYRPGPDLKIRRHPAGRFLTAGGHLHILEDYHNELKDMLHEGPLTPEHEVSIAALKSHPRLDVATLHEINSGARPELWEPAAPKPPPAPIFEVLRHDQDRSDRLEFIDGKAHLNGHPLDPTQTKALMAHVRNGHATVRYSQVNGQAVRKMEQALESLMKADDPAQAASVNEALGKLDQLVQQGLLEPHHAEALRTHAFKDPMTGHVMGNKFAHTDFLNRADAKSGIHIMMDGNDFKSINDKYGHETGDSAIRAMGKAVREAMDESVGREHGKLFRVGGDEFAAHVPTHEHAAKFARALRSKLEGILPIQGQHRLSMGIGMGTSPQQADQALYQAKTQKYDPSGMVGPDSRKWISKYAPGTAPSFAHSLVPGFEGPIPLDHTQMHVKAPPAPMPKPPPPEPVIHTPNPPAPATPGAPAAPAVAKV